MGRDDSLADAQPQAVAIGKVFTLPRFVAAIKPFEDMG